MLPDSDHSTHRADQPEHPEARSGAVSQRWREAVALASLSVLILLAVPGLYRYQGPPMEEGFMLAFPEQILKGFMPHRDFLHLYGPGSLWVLAAVYKVFGVSLSVERSVGLVQQAATTFGLYFLLRPFGRRIATSAAGLSFVVLIGPAGLSALAWNGALALGVCSLALGAYASMPRVRIPRTLSALSGICAGAALLYRPDMVIAIGLGSLAMLMRLESSRRKPMILGAIGTLALFIPHLVISGPAASIKGMFIEPVFELRPGRTLPAPPSWNSIDGFFQRVGTLRTTGWPLPMLAQSHQLYIWFWLIPLSIAVTVFAAWRLRRTQPHSILTTVLWPASLFSAALVTQALQRPDSTHLSWVSGISFALAIPALYTLVRDFWPSMRPDGARALAIGAPLAILLLVIPFYPVRTYVDLVGQSFGHNRFGFAVQHEGRTFYLGDERSATAAQTVTDALGELSSPGQSLIVGPFDLSRTNYNDSYFYYLFPELRAGTRYIEMDPGLADERGSGLPDEISKADWLILSDVWSGWTEPNTSSQSRSEEANRVVEAHFCTVTDSGLFRLLKRCR